MERNVVCIDHNMSNVNVNSVVKITFSADVSPKSLVGNIVVFKDIHGNYTGINSLKNTNDFENIKGNVQYKERTLTFTPNEQLNVNTNYIVILNDKIEDIIGNQLIRKEIIVFKTEPVASYPKCEIIKPAYGCISDTVPDFEWKNQFSESYRFQVSKTNTFDVLLKDEFIQGNKETNEIKYRLDFKAQEGMYYARVRSEGGEWSDVHSFFIKEVTDAVVSDQDIPDMQLNDFLDGLLEPIEILEYYPDQNEVNINLKTNIIYIKMKGKVEEERVNFDSCYVFGESFDEEHGEYAHDVVNGSWTLIYDSFFDVTYLIFTPENIDDIEEVEYIETLRSGHLIQKG